MDTPNLHLTSECSPFGSTCFIIFENGGPVATARLIHGRLTAPSAKDLCIAINDIRKGFLAQSVDWCAPKHLYHIGRLASHNGKVAKT